MATDGGSSGTESVFGLLSDVATITLFVVAVYGFVNGLRHVQALSFSARRHWHILRNHHGRPTVASVRRSVAARKERLCATRKYMLRRVGGEPLRTSDELTWLVRSLAAGANAGRTTLTEFLHAHPGTDAEPQTALLELASRYDDYAMRINGRFLLRAVALPVVSAEHLLASAVAAHLRALAATTELRQPVTDAPSGPTTRYEIPGAAAFDLAPINVEVDGGLQLRARRIAIACWHRGAAGTALGYPSLMVEYSPWRWTAQTNEATQPDRYRTMSRVEPLPEPTDDQIRTLPTPQAFPWTPTRPKPNPPGRSRNALLSYNGVLTALNLDRDQPSGPRGRGFREEFDPLSGRQRLHLYLSEVTYEAVKAFNYTTVGISSDVEGAAPLLTLNLISVDREGVVVLVERSGRLGTHPHTFAGTVSGNAELVDRTGIQSDLNELGLPDLLQATAREAREEVGLIYPQDHQDISALGIHTVTSESERGTHVLTLVSTLERSARRWLPNARASDPLEGAWELGDHLLTIDLKAICTEVTKRNRFLSWLKSESFLAPHAVGGLLMLVLAQEGGEYQAVLNDFARAPLAEPGQVPDGVELRRWRTGDCAIGNCYWMRASQ